MCTIRTADSFGTECSLTNLRGYGVLLRVPTVRKPRGRAASQFAEKRLSTSRNGQVRHVACLFSQLSTYVESGPPHAESPPGSCKPHLSHWRLFKLIRWKHVPLASWNKQTGASVAEFSEVSQGMSAGIKWADCHWQDCVAYWCFIFLFRVRKTQITRHVVDWRKTRWLEIARRWRILQVR